MTVSEWEPWDLWQAWHQPKTPRRIITHTQHMLTATGSAPSHRETEGRSQPVSESSPHLDTPFRTTLWRPSHRREGRLLPGPSESPEEGPARPHAWPRRLPEILPAQGGCPFQTAPAFSQPKVGALKVPCALMGTGVGTRVYSQVEHLHKRMPWGAKGWGEKKTWEEIARTLTVTVLHSSLLSDWRNAALPIQP